MQLKRVKNQMNEFGINHKRGFEKMVTGELLWLQTLTYFLGDGEKYSNQYFYIILFIIKYKCNKYTAQVSENRCQIHCIT